MKAFLSEKNLVIVLFVLVFISFSLAHENSKNIEKAYFGLNSSAISRLSIPGIEIPQNLPQTPDELPQ